MDRRLIVAHDDDVPDKSLGDTASDVISDSSGVGTSQSDTTNNSLTIPGTTVVCVESYTSGGIPGHLSINQGDILEGKSYQFTQDNARTITRLTQLFFFSQLPAPRTAVFSRVFYVARAPDCFPPTASRRSDCDTTRMPPRYRWDPKRWPGKPPLRSPIEIEFWDDGSRSTSTLPLLLD